MVTEDKKYSVVRDCGYTILMNISMRRIDPDGNRCYKRDQDNIDHVVCNCFGDGCNGAEEIDLSFLLLLLPCLTLFLNVFPLEWRVSI